MHSAPEIAVTIVASYFLRSPLATSKFVKLSSTTSIVVFGQVNPPFLIISLEKPLFSLLYAVKFL